MNCKHYRDVYGNCASYKLIGYCPSMERWAQTLLTFAILIVVLAIVCLCYTLIDKFSSHEYKEIPDVPSH